jgi:hypothetical protein
MPGRTRLGVSETGPLDLIGAIASAVAVAGRDDFIVESKISGSFVIFYDLGSQTVPKCKKAKLKKSPKIYGTQDGQRWWQ